MAQVSALIKTGPEVQIRHDHRAFVLLYPEREWIFAADPEGRIALVHTPQRSFKRSRYNVWYEVCWKPWPRLRELDVAVIQEQLPSWKDSWKSAVVQASKQSRIEQILTMWIENFEKFHSDDALLFASIYRKIPILPPDAYQALYIRVQEGCPWNQCTFCTFYQDDKYRVVPAQEVALQFELLRKYWGNALRSRHGIFLGDANAIAVPPAALLQRLRMIQVHFPENELSEIHSFVDYFDGPRRTLREWMALRELGLARLSLGLESGDQSLMFEAKKPIDIATLSHFVKEVHRSNIAFNMIFLIGLGGKRFQESHFLNSMKLLKQLHPARKDRIYLSPLIIDADSYYAKIAAADNWGELDQGELSTELTRWVTAIRSCHTVQVSPYHIRRFIY